MTNIYIFLLVSDCWETELLTWAGISQRRDGGNRDLSGLQSPHADYSLLVIDLLSLLSVQKTR